MYGVNMLDYKNFSERLGRIMGQESILDAISLEDMLHSIPEVSQIADQPRGTTVLLRMDLDVPVQEGAIQDTSRLVTALPTLRHCVNQGWKVVILGHLGRDGKESLQPVSETLSTLIDRKIQLLEAWLSEDQTKLADSVPKTITDAEPGSVFMLENTRRYEIETALWDVTNEHLETVRQRMYSLSSDIRARLASAEINEAIAASNLDFSSSVLPLTMSHTALGFFIAAELKEHVTKARKANLVVFSGLKINKLDDLEAIAERGKLMMVITAGSIAMALKKAQAQLDGGDFSIGRAEKDPNERSYIPEDRIDQAKRIVRLFRLQKVDLVLPVDFVLDNGENAQQIPGENVQLDIGPQSRDLLRQKVADYISASRESQTPFVMFHNGVLGKFEDRKFEEGTREFMSLLKGMTQAGIGTYVGGGEGRLALEKYGDLADVTHAFTAGGTILKSLSDRHIAFLKAMYLQNTMS